MIRRLRVWRFSCPQFRVTIRINQIKKQKGKQNYGFREQFKERIEEDLHQAFADYGIGANFSQHHVEKLNVSYDALSVTPEGSHIGVNANLSAMFEAIENGLRLSLIESQQISLMSVREYGESESPSRDLPGGGCRSHKMAIR